MLRSSESDSAAIRKLYHRLLHRYRRDSPGAAWIDTGSSQATPGLCRQGG